jgi:dipeptidyl aminopeptidase/acylaminoacyl peptidase
MRPTLFALGALVLSACPLVAAKPASWTIDEVILAESLHDIQLSPDGRWAVWVHNAPDKDKGEEASNLVRLELSSGRETILTRGPDNCAHPRWSPDGKRLAFLSTRSASRDRADDEPKSQIWLMDPTGGEPWALTRFSPGVLHYDWAGPNALVFAAQQKTTQRASIPKGEKDDSLVVEEACHEPPVRLFRVEVSSKKVTRLTDNEDWIEKLAVSPHGRRAVATVRTTRYRAAIAGAGNVEYISDWANCEFGDAFDRYYFGASPLEEPLRYLLKSPFFALHRVRTPTLIFFGTEDRTVPVSQGWVQYRAVQQLGKTDVRFVLFPGEKHLLKKLVHQRRKVKEELAWLDRYLFHTTKDGKGVPRSSRVDAPTTAASVPCPRLPRLR